MLLTARHSQVVTSRGSEHSLHEPATCRKIAQISSSHQCVYAARWPKCGCATWSASRELAGYLVGKPRPNVGSSGNSVVTWRPTQMLTGGEGGGGGGDRATGRSVPGGVITRGSHCLKVWTKNNRWWRCCQPRVSFLLQSRRPQRGSGSKVWRRTTNILQTESALGRLSNDVPGQSWGTGQSETRRHAKPLDTGSFQVRLVRHEEG